MAPGLVQKGDTFTNNGTTLTLTLGSNITPGNGLIVAFGQFGSIAGGSDTFTSATIGGLGIASISYVLSSVGGYSSIVLSSISGGVIYAYEVSPLASFDAANAGQSTSVASPWSSGSCLGNFSSEIFVGMNDSHWGTTASTITGPGGSWVNSPSHVYVGSKEIAISGYLLSTTTGSQTYSGTSTGSGTPEFGTGIASFKFAPPFSPNHPVSVRQAVRRSAYY